MVHMLRRCRYLVLSLCLIQSMVYCGHVAIGDMSGNKPYVMEENREVVAGSSYLGAPYDNFLSSSEAYQVSELCSPVRSDSSGPLSPICIDTSGVCADVKVGDYEEPIFPCVTSERGLYVVGTAALRDLWNKGMKKNYPSGSERDVIRKVAQNPEGPKLWSNLRCPCQAEGLVWGKAASQIAS